MQPICLSTNKLTTDPEPRTPLIITGWGQLRKYRPVDKNYSHIEIYIFSDPFASLYPEFMQQAVVPVLADEVCIEKVI